MESSAVTKNTLSSDGSVVFFYHTFANGKAQSTPTRKARSGFIYAIKPFKNKREMLFRNPHPGVLNFQHSFIITSVKCNKNFATGLIVKDGIGDQIIDHSGKAFRVAIVLDMMMPVMDGTQFLAKFRKLYKAPVLILSARDTVANRIDGLNLGADDYLTKPFSMAELFARLQH